MIDIRISGNGCSRHLDVRGDLKEVASDFALAISILYAQMAARDSSKVAEYFKALIQHVFADGSPVWNDDFSSLPALYASGDMAGIIRRAFERGAQRDAD